MRPAAWSAPASASRFAADMVFKAIGQSFWSRRELDGAAELLELDGRQVVVDGERRTSLPGVWAGGDCGRRRAGPDGAGGQDGKLAAARRSTSDISAR